MYVRKKEKVCIVDGKEAIAIYDFNTRRLYRVGSEVKHFFKQLESGNSLNIELLDEKTFNIVKDCLDIGLLETSEENFLTSDSFNDNINNFIDNDIDVVFCWLEITSYCNQKCIHCFMGNELNKNKLDINSIRIIAKDLSEMGVKKVALTGGEPTLHPNFLEILDILNEFNFKIIILTNGLNISDEMITKFRQYNVITRIPLLGLEKTHDRITGVSGAYKKCFNNINKLKNNSINLTITTTVMELNKNEIEQIQDIADNLDLDFEKGPIFPIGEAKKNWELLVTKDYQDILSNCHDFDFNPGRSIYSDEHYVNVPSKIKKYVDCGTRNIAITSSGYYVPCLLLRDSIFSMGSTYNKSIMHLVSEKNDNFRNLQDKMSTNNITPCNNCETRHICKGGGCKAVSYLFNNNIEEKNPHYLKCYY
ncbi:radical SAM protein [Clostridium sp. CS001]|uniref:radical SAM/SPASM domain-containing protein n=1 Tax=Clostridium sp. CS001 TaxID=2880648 RepID=UPI001CF2B8E2|nr:radical SAM protein [Clostridium sp. CS001]MCB2289468.1 radical SAM protein [Clostridium sp. CS001]